jgi:hypothetical protein
MICLWCLFIGAWEHPTMPLTKREAEIHNKPLGKEAMRAVWNQIHNKIDPNVAAGSLGMPLFSFADPFLEQMPLSKRATTFGKSSSAWEAFFP